jgi:hypothetical protein
MESPRQVLLNSMLACAFPFLKLKLCRRNAGMPWKSNIVEHAFIEIGNGIRFAPKWYQWQAKEHINVMASSISFTSLHLSCYVVHKLSSAAG